MEEPVVGPGKWGLLRREVKVRPFGCPQKGSEVETRFNNSF
jgi:hypothetical protein